MTLHTYAVTGLVFLSMVGLDRNYAWGVQTTAPAEKNSTQKDISNSQLGESESSEKSDEVVRDIIRKIKAVREGMQPMTITGNFSVFSENSSTTSRTTTISMCGKTRDIVSISASTNNVGQTRPFRYIETEIGIAFSQEQSSITEYYPAGNKARLGIARAEMISSMYEIPLPHNVLFGSFRSENDWLDTQMLSWLDQGMTSVVRGILSNNGVRIEFIETTIAGTIVRQSIDFQTGSLPIVTRRESRWPSGAIFARLVTTQVNPQAHSMSELLEGAQVHVDYFSGGPEGATTYSSTYGWIVSDARFLSPNDCSSINLSKLLDDPRRTAGLFATTADGGTVQFEKQPDGSLKLLPESGPTYENLQAKSRSTARDAVVSRREVVGWTSLIAGTSLAIVVWIRLRNKARQRV